MKCKSRKQILSHNCLSTKLKEATKPEKNDRGTGRTTKPKTPNSKNTPNVHVPCYNKYTDTEGLNNSCLLYIKGIGGHFYLFSYT